MSACPLRPFPVLVPRSSDPANGCVCVVCCGVGNSFNDEERVVVAGYDNGDVKVPHNHRHLTIFTYMD
jgi:hypothetical protein